MAGMSNALECQNLYKFFNHIPAVDDLSFVVEQGEFVTLLGPSGCGKTTTLRLIAGFEEPDNGTIKINERVVANGSGYTPPEKRNVGMVFQDYALFPHVNVAENIAFGLKDKSKAKQKRVDSLLDLVGLAGYQNRMPHELSGGQQQRVALARALAPQPDILMLDEPFSNLDTSLREQVRADVRKILRETGTTAIFVTHDQHEALSLSDEVAVMFHGKLAQMTTPHALYNRPVSKQVAEFVGEANFLSATAQGSHAESILGTIPIVNPRQGKVDLLIRPEALKLNVLGDGFPAEVLWREYYGHEQRLGMRLSDGTTLVARANVDVYYERGQQVGVNLKMAVMAFGKTADLTN